MIELASVGSAGNSNSVEVTVTSSSNEPLQVEVQEVSTGEQRLLIALATGGFCN